MPPLQVSLRFTHIILDQRGEIQEDSAQFYTLSYIQVGGGDKQQRT